LVSATVVQADDGGFFVAVNQVTPAPAVPGNDDCWVLKVDGDLNLVWQRVIGASGDDYPQGILTTDDGGCVVIGYFMQIDVNGVAILTGFWIEKLDAAGTTEWQSILGDGSAWAYGADRTADGGYVLVGATRASNPLVTGHHGDEDLWVVKVSATGQLQWQRCYGGSNKDVARAVEQTSDGGYIVVGASWSYDGDVSEPLGTGVAWVIKLDATGVLQWENKVGGSYLEEALGVTEDDGGYVVCGAANSIDGDVSNFYGGLNDAWVFKLDGSGGLLWERNFGGTYGEVFRNIERHADGSFILAGYTESIDIDVQGQHGMLDTWVVKLASDDVGVGEAGVPSFTLTPHPSDGLVRIEVPAAFSQASISVIDAAGRVVLDETMTGTSRMLDIRGRAPGAYLLTLRSTSGIHTERLLLE
jgi:hypothetical protein